VTVEADLFAALGPLASSRVYPDVAPAGAVKPYITYQQVGGAALAFVESAAVGKRNARFQVNVWATTRTAAAALARTVEDTLVASTTLRATPVGAMNAEHEPETGLYGTRQDFSIWY
jgi:hypothetical protein